MSTNFSHPYVTVEDICFGYTTNTPVIRNLSIRFFPGEFTAIVGANGSGKTTLGKLIAGLLKPWTGVVKLKGCPTSGLRLGQIGQYIGYLFQDVDRQIFATSVREELTFVPRLLGMAESQMEQRVESLLDQFDLRAKADAVPFMLSQGEKQRLVLAAILMQNPPFLILDEPTTGLDRERKNQLSAIIRSLRAQNIGFVIISHDQAFVETHADRVIEMDRGAVIADTKN